MARGISIGDVENKVQHISDNNVIPLSTGADVPEVVTVGVLKEHINEDIDTALEGKQDVISDLATIRSGAALGATALQSYTETDPTVPSWAKAASKPSYTASEVGALPDTTVIPTESTVTGWGFTKNAGTITGITMNSASMGTSGVVDLGTVITSHQDISGKENTSNKVTSLSSSSTDTQYPSAKCVYDLVGDIETILTSI